MRAEIRSRQLTGRHQISDGGQHLVDGVPFGRPYLREPNRPAVRIPPRKRARLEEITNEAAELLMRAQQLSKAQQDALVAVTQVPASNGAGKSVHFAQAEDTMELDEGSDSEDEDDDDFAPGADDDDDVDQDIDEDVDSGSDSDSSSASDASDPDSASHLSSDDSSSDSGSDSDSDSDSDAAPEVRSSKTPVPKPVIPPQPPTNENTSPPGEGKKTTQTRNARRMRTNRLKHLKEAGKLPKDADLKALDEYDEEQRLQQSETLSQRQGFAQSAGKRKRLDDEEAAQPVLDESAELAKRKQEMIARFGQDSDVTMGAEESSSNKVESPASVTPQQQQEESSATPEKTPERKRLRPDVSAIGRMLARQTKNLVKKPAKTIEKAPTPEPEGSTDPEFWKSRINLSAFECWEEEYELTAPPFPFVQHWDPVGKVMRKKAKKGGKKAPPPVEEYEEEEEEEEDKIFLNYDDTPDFNPDVEIHAAIEDQLQQDIATAAQEQDEFPPIPEDLDALPDLTSADIKVGAVIVCKFFGINPVTVTPETSDFKTAIVEQEGDSGGGAGTFRLRIAQRDLPKKEKKFNSKGQRVYDAKDGFFMEEDDEEGLWSGMFGELVQGKLLKTA
jgi:hypothetical protein